MFFCEKFFYKCRFRKKILLFSRIHTNCNHINRTHLLNFVNTPSDNVVQIRAIYAERVKSCVILTVCYSLRALYQ